MAVSWDVPEVVENSKGGRSEPPLPLIGYVVRVCTGVDADGDGKKDVVKEVNLALEELEGKESEDGRAHWVDVQKLPTDGTAYACQVRRRRGKGGKGERCTSRKKKEDDG